MQSANAAARDAVACGFRICGAVDAADERLASGSAATAASRAVTVSLDAADHSAHQYRKAHESDGKNTAGSGE
jgi:hypothetical protein